MNVAIRTRLAAIDAQMDELQKEQAKLREELDNPEFWVKRKELETEQISLSGLAEALELSLAMYFRDPSVDEAKALNVIVARLQRDIDAERERQERILTGRV